MNGRHRGVLTRDPMTRNLTVTRPHSWETERLDTHATLVGNSDTKHPQFPQRPHAISCSWGITDSETILVSSPRPDRWRLPRISEHEPLRKRSALRGWWGKFWKQFPPNRIQGSKEGSKRLPSGLVFLPAWFPEHEIEIDWSDRRRHRRASSPRVPMHPLWIISQFSKYQCGLHHTWTRGLHQQEHAFLVCEGIERGFVRVFYFPPLYSQANQWPAGKCAKSSLSLSTSNYNGSEVYEPSLQRWYHFVKRKKSYWIFDFLKKKNSNGLCLKSINGLSEKITFYGDGKKAKKK